MYVVGWTSSTCDGVYTVFRVVHYSAAYDGGNSADYFMLLEPFACLKNDDTWEKVDFRSSVLPRARRWKRRLISDGVSGLNLL